MKYLVPLAAGVLLAGCTVSPARSAAASPAPSASATAPAWHDRQVTATSGKTLSIRLDFDPTGARVYGHLGAVNLVCGAISMAAPDGSFGIEMAPVSASGTIATLDFHFMGTDAHLRFAGQVHSDGHADGIWTFDGSSSDVVPACVGRWSG